MSWSRKPIIKTNSSADCDIGPPLSDSDNSVGRLKPFLKEKADERILVESIDDSNDWEVIDKRLAPRVPKRKKKSVIEIH